ncbi:hypothetical protein VTG60DRAFT_6963 [Thermothelomyces hinnuleus]
MHDDICRCVHCVADQPKPTIGSSLLGWFAVKGPDDHRGYARPTSPAFPLALVMGLEHGASCWENWMTRSPLRFAKALHTHTHFAAQPSCRRGPDCRNGPATHHYDRTMHRCSPSSRTSETMVSGSNHFLTAAYNFPPTIRHANDLGNGAGLKAFPALDLKKPTCCVHMRPTTPHLVSNVFEAPSHLRTLDLVGFAGPSLFPASGWTRITAGQQGPALGPVDPSDPCHWRIGLRPRAGSISRAVEQTNRIAALWLCPNRRKTLRAVDAIRHEAAMA